MVRTDEGFVLYLCAKFEADSSIRSKITRGPKLRNWLTSPRPRPLMGSFIVRTQGGSVLYVCTKFEANRLPLFVKRWAKFRNWVT